MSAAKRRCSSTCRRCYASLFTDRAITYRKLKGFDHNQVALSIGVQLMVRSDIGGSGVMFSIDTETGFDKVVLINAAWGLGENVVQGAVTPTNTGLQAAARQTRPQADRREDLGAKEIKMIYAGTEGGDDQERADLEEPSAGLCSAVRRGDPDLARQAADHRGALRPADGHGMGQGRRDRASSSSSRPGPKRCSRASMRPALKSYTIKKTGKTLLTGLSVGAAVRAGARSA
jgi:pyruvate,water dikinase